jgi:hypothetical protein
MKTIARTCLAFLMMSFVMVVGAGAQRAGGGAPTISVVMNRQLSSIEHEFMAIAEYMPEDKYNFKPTHGNFATVRTFAEQIKHVAAANYSYGSAVLGEKSPAAAGGGENGPDSIATKAQILKFARGSFAYLHKAADSLNASNATAPARGGRATKLGLIVGIIGHVGDHYGQVIEYMRDAGLDPQKALAAARHPM